MSLPHYLLLVSCCVLSSFVSAQTSENVQQITSTQNAMQLALKARPHPLIQDWVSERKVGRFTSPVFWRDSSVYRSNPKIVSKRPRTTVRSDGYAISVDSLNRIFNTSNATGLWVYYHLKSDTIKSFRLGIKKYYTPLFTDGRLVSVHDDWDYAHVGIGFVIRSGKEPILKMRQRRHYAFTYDEAGRPDTVRIGLEYGTQIKDSVRADSVLPEMIRIASYDPKTESTLITSHRTHIPLLSKLILGTTAYRITASDTTRIDVTYGADGEELTFTQIDFNWRGFNIMERRSGHPEQTGYMVERFTYNYRGTCFGAEALVYGDPGELREHQIGVIGRGYQQPQGERDPDTAKLKTGYVSNDVFDADGNYLRPGEIRPDWPSVINVYPE